MTCSCYPPMSPPAIYKTMPNFEVSLQNTYTSAQAQIGFSSKYIYFSSSTNNVIHNSLLVSFLLHWTKLPHIDKFWNMYFTSFRCNRILFRWYTIKEWQRSFFMRQLQKVKVVKVKVENISSTFKLTKKKRQLLLKIVLDPPEFGSLLLLPAC